MKKNNNDRRQTISTIASGLAIIAAAGLSASSHADAPKVALKVGGYIKLDAMSSSYSDGDLDLPAVRVGRDYYLPPLIPVGGEGEGRDTDFHAKSSRINFQTTSDVEGEKLVSFVEIDFLNGAEGDERVSNSYQPRLRHAYFTYGKWLFGQTWSTFQNVTALPETLDFVGPAEGTVFVRQAQVRYTRDNWQFSLENPETTVTSFGTATRTVTDDGAMPDMVARYTFKGDRGNWDVAGIVRNLAYEDVATSVDATAFGYGISVSAKLKMGERDDLRLMATTGSGLGRYIALNTVNGAALDAAGDLETIDATSAMVSYRHLWTDQWRSNISLGMFQADHDMQLVSNAVTKEVQSLHVNLLYSPVRSVTLGVELMKAERELENGDSGSLNRLQFSAKHDF